MDKLIVEEVLRLTDMHQHTWRDQSDTFWMMGLMQEIGELSGALIGRHHHTPETELRQIAAICINWLDYRSTRNAE